MVDRSSSRYPYSADGQIAVPATADWNDPMIGLSFAAAATSTIGIATGVLLLPEHNPVLIAKQAATLDTLSGGRLTLGVGVGWSREEFDALGVPFARRAARTAEYVAAMRTLWREDVASFDGEFVRFDAVRVNPKPVRDRQIPVVLGGNSDAALAGSRHGATVGTASTSTVWGTSPNASRTSSPMPGAGRDPASAAPSPCASRRSATSAARRSRCRRTGDRREPARRCRCRSRLGIGACRQVDVGCALAHQFPHRRSCGLGGLLLPGIQQAVGEAVLARGRSCGDRQPAQHVARDDESWWSPSTV